MVNRIANKEDRDNKFQILTEISTLQSKRSTLLNDLAMLDGRLDGMIEKLRSIARGTQLTLQ